MLLFWRLSYPQYLYRKHIPLFQVFFRLLLFCFLGPLRVLACGPGLSGGATPRVSCHLDWVETVLRLFAARTSCRWLDAIFPFFCRRAGSIIVYVGPNPAGFHPRFFWIFAISPPPDAPSDYVFYSVLLRFFVSVCELALVLRRPPFTLY